MPSVASSRAKLTPPASAGRVNSNVRLAITSPSSSTTLNSNTSHQPEVEAVKESLATIRHYLAVRFAMLASYMVIAGFIASGLATSNAERKEFLTFVAESGALWLFFAASLWFLWFEFVISIYLIRLWSAVQSSGGQRMSIAWAHRSPGYIWLGRVALPLPYLAGFSWSLEMAAGLRDPSTKILLAAAVLVAICTLWFFEEQRANAKAPPSPPANGQA